ncbi:Uncharacterized protein TPAR_03705, partial [Tolypocladium paradoxum]
SVKLRDVTVAFEPSSFYCVRWAAPKHPAEIIDLEALRRPRCLPSGLRMSYFDCNAPGTTGYSHDDDVWFYRDIHHAFVYIYRPINKGEYLTEIYARHASAVYMKMLSELCSLQTEGEAPYSDVMLRALILITAEQGAWPRGAPLTFADSIAELKHTAFEKSSTPVKRVPPSSLLPTTPFKGTQSNEPWFFSSCSMKDIAEIAVCRNIFMSHRPIIGMLLRYTSGHKASLGQFRFDMALEKIRGEEGKGYMLAAKDKGTIFSRRLNLSCSSSLGSRGQV